MKQKDRALSAIDLFCGAGGLTLGLERAGFNVVGSVELNAEIAKTYKANHPTTKLLVKDIREVTGKELFELTGLERIDLVAGCPPCQGFSTLTSKYHKEDPRNELVLEMARLVEELMPQAVMLENVPGLAIRGKSLLDEFVGRLESMGYVVSQEILQMADYGVPQSRRRLVLLAGRGFPIELPRQTHYPRESKKERTWLTLADAIKIKGTSNPTTLSEAAKKGGPQKLNWHVVRDLTPISLRRLSALKAGDNRRSLPRHLRPKCHEGSDKGFQNVYGRLTWHETPPTITAGCTTPCKGRFGHPSQLRTISVREAALIQTFPMNYRFDTEFMDTVCDMVGNALPPKFAAKVARSCKNALLSNAGG